MKKTLLLVVALFMVFTLSACGNKHNFNELQTLEMEYTLDAVVTIEIYGEDVEMDMEVVVDGSEAEATITVLGQSQSVDLDLEELEFADAYMLFPFLFVDEDMLSDDFTDFDTDSYEDFVKMMIVNEDDYTEEEIQAFIDVLEDEEVEITFEIEDKELVGFTVIGTTFSVEVEVDYE